LILLQDIYHDTSRFVGSSGIPSDTYRPNKLSSKTHMWAYFMW